MKTNLQDGFKSLDWSYPSSPNAVAAGYGRAGCWTVSIEHKGLPVAVSSFVAKADAIHFANTALPNKWGTLWAQYAVTA